VHCRHFEGISLKVLQNVVGDKDGANVKVGELVGEMVGEAEGDAVVGESVGNRVGVIVGVDVVGEVDGDGDGDVDGDVEGVMVGDSVGDCDGVVDGGNVTNGCGTSSRLLPPAALDEEFAVFSIGSPSPPTPTVPTIMPTIAINTSKAVAAIMMVRRFDRSFTGPRSSIGMCGGNEILFTVVGPEKPKLETRGVITGSSTNGFFFTIVGPENPKLVSILNDPVRARALFFINLLFGIFFFIAIAIT